MTLLSPTVLHPLPGITVFANRLPLLEQDKIIKEARVIIKAAPFFAPQMANGTKFRQRLSNCGAYGWIAGPSKFDQSTEYRYTREHPVTGAAWPAIPPNWLALTNQLIAELKLPAFHPESCLLNWYPFPNGRLGMHVDNTEDDLASPIITISLGYSCRFRIAHTRQGNDLTLPLHSGDIVVMHGKGRNLWHGVLGLTQASPLFPEMKGRLSLTLRKVKK